MDFSDNPFAQDLFSSVQDLISGESASPISSKGKNISSGPFFSSLLKPAPSSYKDPSRMRFYKGTGVVSNCTPHESRSRVVDNTAGISPASSARSSSIFAPTRASSDKVVPRKEKEKEKVKVKAREKQKLDEAKSEGK